MQIGCMRLQFSRAGSGECSDLIRGFLQRVLWFALRGLGGMYVAPPSRDLLLRRIDAYFIPLDQRLLTLETRYRQLLLETRQLRERIEKLEKQPES